MKRKLILLISTFLLIGMSLFSIEIKSSNELHTESGRFETDYLYYGERLNFKGEADDIYFAGKELNFEGETRSTVTAIGNRVVINGEVGNDLTAAGDRVEINGKVRGTTFIIGEDVLISEGAHIVGTIFAGAGNLEIRGRVDGDIYLGSGKLLINGVVNGNIKACGNDLSFGDEGKVNGMIEYHSSKKMPQSLEGYDNLEYIYKRNYFIDPFDSVILALIFALAFFLGGFLLMLFPAMRAVVKEERSGKQVGALTLWGLIPVFVYPIIIILLGLTIIGIPMALLLMLAALPIFFVAQIIGIVLAGQYLFVRLNRQGGKGFKYYLVGAVIYLVISAIPFIGCLAGIAVSALGWGYLLEKLFARELA